MNQMPDSFLNDFLYASLQAPAGVNAQGTLANGVGWQLIGKGAIAFHPEVAAQNHPYVLLSSGIHGNETAPIEICCHLIRDIWQGHILPAGPILFLLGNLDAMTANKRYLDDDMNRLFSGRHRAHPHSREALRAAALESICQAFFQPALTNNQPRIHLDLHTAIRGSYYPQFAIAPYRTNKILSHRLHAWLQCARIEAVLLNAKPAGTFSYFSSNTFQAESLTLELGKALPFGDNQLSQFEATRQALVHLIEGSPLKRDQSFPIKAFQVTGEIERKTEAHFQLLVEDQVENFTAYPKGTVLAIDEQYEYVVQAEEERIVFPNRTVKPGLRAGLMVTETRLMDYLQDN